MRLKINKHVKCRKNVVTMNISTKMTNNPVQMRLKLINISVHQKTVEIPQKLWIEKKKNSIRMILINSRVLGCFENHENDDFLAT